MQRMPTSACLFSKLKNLSVLGRYVHSSYQIGEVGLIVFFSEIIRLFEEGFSECLIVARRRIDEDVC